MEYKSDIEIAQACEMEPITAVAQRAGVDEAYLEQYGRYKAKVDYKLLKDKADAPDGKLILVTAITPTPAGEGKTTTTIGLGDALRRIGKNVVIALREPSLGPVFGIKGTSTSTSPATSTPSARQTTCSPRCWTTTFSRAMCSASTRAGSPGAARWT